MTLNISAILCLIGGLYGFYVLYKYLHITSNSKKTCLYDALPVVIGTLAWLTAGFEFYNAIGHVESQVVWQRALMVLSWCWLARSYRIRRQ